MDWIHAKHGIVRFFLGEPPPAGADPAGWLHEKHGILPFSLGGPPPAGANPALRAWRYADRIIREGLPMPREPALLTSGGRMPERGQHRVSEGRMP